MNIDDLENMVNNIEKVTASRAPGPKRPKKNAIVNSDTSSVAGGP